MRVSRRKASAFLTCILVTGGLFAPLSHLVYMAANDMYVPMHGTSHHGHEHEECYQDVHHGHEHCPYLALFAVPLVGDMARPVTSPVYDPVAEPLLHPFSVQQQPGPPELHLARGPPHG